MYIEKVSSCNKLYYKDLVGCCNVSLDVPPLASKKYTSYCWLCLLALAL